MIRLIATLFCLSATAFAQIPAPPVPLELLDGNRGFDLTMAVAGTKPIKFQWYRETGTLKKVRVAIPGATMATLEFRAPYTAGTYSCDATNIVGTITSRPVKVSVTGVPGAPEMAIVIKQP